jgi:hypothetical protein
LDLKLVYFRNLLNFVLGLIEICGRGRKEGEKREREIYNKGVIRTINAHLLHFNFFKFGSKHRGD